jgi:hypothetical protein
MAAGNDPAATATTSGTVEFGRAKKTGKGGKRGSSSTGKKGSSSGSAGKRKRDPYAIKKTKSKDRPQVVEYDDGARQEYLTGFHKRKLEKQKAGALKRAAAAAEELREARRERARPLSLVKDELERIEALNQEIREAAAAAAAARAGGGIPGQATTTTIIHGADSGQTSIVTITPLEL